MKRSKSPGADSSDAGPEPKRLQSSPAVKVEDKRDNTPPVDSEAETEIVDGGSRNNTPLKRSQGLRSGHNHIHSKDKDNEAVERTPNGDDKAGRAPSETPGSVVASRKKRKIGSDVYSNGDDDHPNSHRGSTSARSSEKLRGSPAKKARLSSGSEGDSDDSRPALDRPSRLSRDPTSTKSSKLSKRRSLGGDAPDDVSIQQRQAKFHTPASKADQLAQRAATQEPRPRSSSPVKQPHKRSSSFAITSVTAGTPNDPPRRLRNRRGSPEYGQRGDERSSSYAASKISTGEARNDVDRNGRTPLAKACADGQVSRVKQILESSHDDVDVPDYAENTPLQSAALDGYTEIVKLLVKAGCNVHCSNMDGDTPLIDAVTNGHVEVVEILLKQGVDPRRKNFAGQFPKDVLPEDDDDGEILAKMLDDAITKRIASGIDDERYPDKRETQSVQATSRTRRGHLGEKSLHFVQPNLALLRKYAADGDIGGVGFVLECNIKADNSCMVAAAAGGHADVLSLMLADNNRPDPDPNPSLVKNSTPMLAAIGRGNLEVIELLLAQKGFDPRRRTVDNKTYYEIAEDRKGPRWEKEIQMLQEAYNGITHESKISTSPQQPRRKRLVSGKERAEEEQQKAEEARVKAEEDDQAHEVDRKPTEEERRKADARTEQDLQRRASEANQKEENARKKAEDDRLKAEAVEAKKREAEEQKRKQDEEEAAEKKRKQQQQQQREQEERDKEKKRLAAEEAEKKRAEAERRKREADEAERKRKEAEEEARKQREALELERKRKLEEEEEARRRYLEAMPRALKRALTPHGRYLRDRPGGDENLYKKTLRDWLPLWLVRRSAIDPNCPSGLENETWMPNFQAAVFLHHDRLDTCKKAFGWQSLPLTSHGRNHLWISAPLSDWLVRDERWMMASIDKLEASGLHYSIFGKDMVSLYWRPLIETAKRQWMDLPNDQVFWVKVEDFISQTTPEKAPHLKGLRITTRTWSYAGETGDVTTHSDQNAVVPAEDYMDGRANPNSAFTMQRLAVKGPK